ncbi:hypothetical protein AMEX_G6480 [Astyanax mexicanus]|uniref:Uncharacterized protein n=1 Tax=Astyanax mexicanus TaxID=7994 RepID=A0A8T2M4N5_ASTMX|nr:hypothetical protein AMEX_G6480 [Astyanax mexicanus]
MTSMNKTVLLALLTRCRETLLKELENKPLDTDSNATTVAPTQPVPVTSARQSYDNAYFYVLFVMFIYSFLALTLFQSFLQSEKSKKEFISSADATGHKYEEDSMTEKFDFDEENII